MDGPETAWHINDQRSRLSGPRIPPRSFDELSLLQGLEPHLFGQEMNRLTIEPSEPKETVYDNKTNVSHLARQRR